MSSLAVSLKNATDEQLVDEIARRCAAMVLVTAVQTGPNEEKLFTRWRCPRSQAMGMLNTALMDVLRMIPVEHNPTRMREGHGCPPSPTS